MFLIKSFTNMSGWRGRLGLIVPHNNTTTEPEFYEYVPSGMSVHTCRIKGRGKDRGEIVSDMVRQAYESANRFVIDTKEGLVDEEIHTVGAIGFACFRTSYYRGLGWDEEVRRGIEKASGIPTTTAASSIIKSLREMEMRKIGLVSPYPEESNVRLVQFLNANDFEVGKLVPVFDVPRDPYHNNLIPPWRTYELARKAAVDDVDGILLCVTNFRTFEIIDKLERDVMKPVISANQVLLWDMLNIVGINETMPKLGSLFSC